MVLRSLPPDPRSAAVFEIQRTQCGGKVGIHGGTRPLYQLSGTLACH